MNVLIVIAVSTRIEIAWSPSEISHRDNQRIVEESSDASCRRRSRFQVVHQCAETGVELLAEVVNVSGIGRVENVRMLVPSTMHDRDETCAHVRLHDVSRDDACVAETSVAVA